MLLIKLKQVDNKLTDKELIKNTALALEKKYRFYVLYKRYRDDDQKDYTLWIVTDEDCGEAEGYLWDNLHELEEKHFETFSIEEKSACSFKEIINSLVKEDSLDFYACKLEYREYKVFDKPSKKWIKKIY